jgi:hypothetical protein
MSDESAKRELDLLGENFQEILSSTEAVKGEAFANAVAVSFESAQLMEAIACIFAMIPEHDRERAGPLMEAVKHILSSICVKASGDLSDSDLEEAIDMADKLNDRRRQTAKRIQQELRGG